MSSEPEPFLESGEDKLVGLEAGPLPDVKEGRPRKERENPIAGWARAISLGLRDTANDVLQAGRAGAHDKSEQMWSRFFLKTKARRRRS